MLILVEVVASQSDANRQFEVLTKEYLDQFPAQLTSAKLSTYFVGFLENYSLRQEVEKRRGTEFVLKDYHDEELSFGSPLVQYVRALMLNEPIPSIK